MRRRDKMKRILIVLLVLALALPSLLAADVGVEQYAGSSDSAFAATSPRIDAMGDSGIAAPGRMDSFMANPAALAQKRFGMSFPSVSVTLYNLQALLSDPDDAQIIADAMADPSTLNDQSKMTKLLQDMIENVGAGRNEFLTTDVSLGLALGNLGIGLMAQEKLHTIANGSSNIANVYFVPEMNIGATVALGFRVIDTASINLDIGVSGAFVYKAYSKKVGASDFMDIINDSSGAENKLLWETPVMGGWAVPINAGVTVGLLGNTLRVSAVAKDINSIYHMKSYASAGDLINSLYSGAVTPPAGHVSGTSVDFEITAPWSLTLGMAWVPNVPVVNPVITADLVDMLDIVTGREKFEWKNLLLHLNAGAEVNILKTLAVRAGVNRGYMSLGAGILLPGFNLEASYGWQEFGSVIGDKPVDSFTVRINLGYDKI